MLPAVSLLDLLPPACLFSHLSLSGLSKFVMSLCGVSLDHATVSKSDVPYLHSEESAFCLCVSLRPGQASLVIRAYIQNNDIYKTMNVLPVLILKQVCFGYQAWVAFEGMNK